MRRQLLLSLAVLLLGTASVQAQTPVTDVGNAAINTVTASQSTITAIESVLSVANEVLELMPVEQVIVAQQIAEDMALMGDILNNAELVWYDLQSLDAQITALFGIDNVPTTRSELDARLLDIKQFYYRTLSYAMRTQTLVMTTLRTIDHVTQLVNNIEALLGNMQANQTLVQVNSTMSKTLAVMEVQQSAWQRADTVQRLSEGVIIASMQQMSLHRLDDHPR